MKKLHLFMSIFMVLLLGFAAMAFGTVTPPLGEASVFDAMENWIIRACVMEPAAAPGPPYLIRFQVIDPDTGSDINPDDILTNNVEGLPADITDAHGTDISLTFDSKTGVTYLIYTNSARQVKPYTIESAGPKIAVNSDTLSFGNLTTGNSSTKSVTVSNTGTTDLKLGTISLKAGTNAAYTITSGAGACSNGVVLRPSTDSCTITVRFAPTVEGNANGMLVIMSDGGEADVTLTGSATAPEVTSKPDLTIKSVSGIPSSYVEGQTLRITVTINNKDVAVNSSFTVKGYLNSSGTQSGTPIFTWSLSNLGIGDATQINSARLVSNGCAVHQYCKFLIKVDADNQINESVETNNTYTRSSLRGE